MITPNQFEAELLTQSEIKTFADAKHVCAALRAMGPEVVVLTSCEVEEYPDELVCLSLSNEGLFVVKVEKLAGRFTGTGDVTAAVLLGRGHMGDSFKDMRSTLSLTMGTVPDTCP